MVGIQVPSDEREAREVEQTLLETQRRINKGNPVAAGTAGRGARAGGGDMHLTAYPNVNLDQIGKATVRKTFDEPQGCGAAVYA